MYQHKKWSKKRGGPSGLIPNGTPGESNISLDHMGIPVVGMKTLEVTVAEIIMNKAQIEAAEKGEPREYGMIQEMNGNTTAVPNGTSGNRNGTVVRELTVVGNLSVHKTRKEINNGGNQSQQR